jgi:hypothetical protein
LRPREIFRPVRLDFNLTLPLAAYPQTPME